MKKFILGCITGAFLTVFVDKIFLGGELSTYEFIIGIIDKPFVQTHGICILAGIAFYIFSYRIADSLTQKFYLQSQDIIEKNMKIIGKIISKIISNKKVNPK